MEVFLPLIKYCKKEFNPFNGCKNLQLGTAQYYREMDPSFSIADSQEGMISMHDDKNHIVMENNLGPNCYIFCISTKELSDETAKEQFHTDYDSKYYMNDPDFLATVLGHSLQSQLCLDDFSEGSQQILKQPGFKLRIRHYFGLVRYYGGSFSRDLSDGSFIIPEDVYVKSHFTKREKYSSDAELRILFVAFAFNGETRMALSPKKTPKLLYFPDGLEHGDIFSSEKKYLSYLDDNTVTHNYVHDFREVTE